MATEKMVTEAIQSISIATFLDDLSSKNATPGGGAVAAITGAQAAALISMVCEFSVESPELESIARQAGQARVTFLKLADKDSAAFKLVMSAFKQPKDANNRKEKIQSALVQAAEAPRSMLRLASTLVASTSELLQKGSKNLITDTGIAAILIEATVDSAELNIMINLKSINDENYKQEVMSEIGMCRQKIKRLKEVIDEIRGSLNPGQKS
jgi:formiminotetrahydrofolate cyclodeaminase